MAWFKTLGNSHTSQPPLQEGWSMELLLERGGWRGKIHISSNHWLWPMFCKSVQPPFFFCPSVPVLQGVCQIKEACTSGTPHGRGQPVSAHPAGRWAGNAGLGWYVTMVLVVLMKSRKLYHHLFLLLSLILFITFKCSVISYLMLNFFHSSLLTFSMLLICGAYRYVKQTVWVTGFM